jgi:thiol:disulfide interchange protein DsbD
MKKAWLAVALAFAVGLLAAAVVRAQPAGAAKADRASVRAVLSTQSLQAGQQAVIAVVLEVREGFHAQSHEPFQENLIKCEVTLAANPAVTAYAPIYPPGEVRNYPALGKLSVYEGRTIIYVPLEVKTDAPAAAIKLTGEIEFQICDDKACYPPETKPFVIETTIAAPGRALTPNQPELFKGFDYATFSQLRSGQPAPAAAARQKATGQSIFGDLGPSSYLLAFLSAFFVGMIFNVMPCVLPVVPLKAIGFYEVSQHDRVKSILFGLVFSLGLVASFGVLALLVLVSKTLTWGEQFSNPWFVGAIVTILIAMALSMFGVFTVLLPTGVYSWTPRHDTYTGNFLFGILTAVLSTPCTLGMFVGLLAWAAKQPKGLGVAVVMMVGVGMAFPYLILSAFPKLARRFPRTGRWAELVKQMMGFLLLAVAAYFAGGALIQGRSFFWIILAITAVASIFLVVQTARFSPRLGPMLAASSVAILLTGSVLFVTLRLTAGGGAAEKDLFAWQAYSAEGLESARAGGKIVMVEFTANWCGNCLWLEGNVFSDPRAAEIIKQHGVITLRADLSSKNAAGWPLLKQLNPAGGIPLTAIYVPRQSEPIQLSGIYTTDNLRETIAAAAKVLIATK